jgi:hypothetical protein
MTLAINDKKFETESFSIFCLRRCYGIAVFQGKGKQIYSPNTLIAGVGVIGDKLSPVSLSLMSSLLQAKN